MTQEILRDPHTQFVAPSIPFCTLLFVFRRPLSGISLFFLDLGSRRLQLDFRPFDLFLASLRGEHQFETLVLVPADLPLGALDLCEQSSVRPAGSYLSRRACIR